MDEQTELKRQAALRALDYVRDGMVLGLGSGSTADQFLAVLGERVRGGLRVRGVPTSSHSATLAGRYGIPLTSLDEVDRVDLTVDGADEIVLATFHVIKGRGGALLREKLVARATDIEVVIVDGSKVVERLGIHHPVPVEVVPFGWRQTRAALAALGSEPVLRPADPARADSPPFVTDNGNYTLDCRFPPIEDAAALERAIKLIPGVVECGLFINLVQRAVIANADGVRVVERPAP